MEKIKVMIIGSNDNRIYEIKQLLTSEEIAFVGFSKEGETAVDKVLSIKPDAVVMWCDGEGEAEIELAGRIYTRLPGCCVVMLCEEMRTEVIERAMDAGVRRVLGYPVDARTLIEKIQAAFNMEQTRLSNTATRERNMQSRVVTVFGTKGGIGKTTITVNLAVALARMGKKTAIIDADLQFGDVNVFFDIESKDTIAELAQDREASDIEAIKRMTALHYSGVSVLCAPKSPEYAEYVSAKNIETIVNTMRPYYDYILIDTAPLFNDTTMTAIENAVLVLMVTGMDISVLRNTKTGLGILDSLQQRDKVEIVANRMADGMINIKDMQRVLDTQIKNKISLDYKTALACHNKGVPIMMEAPRTQIAKELTNLANNVISIIDKRVS